MDVPESYVPIRTPARKLDATPLPQDSNGFSMQDENGDVQVPEIPGVAGLEFFKQEDAQYFSKLMGDERNDLDLSIEELKDRKIMRLLLKIKVFFTFVVYCIDTFFRMEHLLFVKLPCVRLRMVLDCLVLGPCLTKFFPF